LEYAADPSQKNPGATASRRELVHNHS
jgi:hypothetical protein